MPQPFPSVACLCCPSIRSPWPCPHTRYIHSFPTQECCCRAWQARLWFGCLPRGFPRTPHRASQPPHSLWLPTCRHHSLMSRPQHDLHNRGGGGENGGGGGGGLSSLVAFASFAARNETEAMDAASPHQRPPPPAPFMQAPGSYGTSSMTSSSPHLATLLHALSTPLRRRFVLAEFFCATVDRDYFHQNEFQESLDLLGLSHVQKLTRTEWSQIRACIGRRRRLSPAFLSQERQRLEEYRQVVRHIQQGVLAGPPPGTSSVECFLSLPCVEFRSTLVFKLILIADQSPSILCLLTQSLTSKCPRPWWWDRA